MKKRLLVAGGILFLVVTLFPDTLIVTDGTYLHGQLMDYTTSYLYFSSITGKYKISRKYIDLVAVTGSIDSASDIIITITRKDGISTSGRLIRATQQYVTLVRPIDNKPADILLSNIYSIKRSHPVPIKTSEYGIYKPASEEIPREIMASIITSLHQFSMKDWAMPELEQFNLGDPDFYETIWELTGDALDDTQKDIIWELIDYCYAKEKFIGMAGDEIEGKNDLTLETIRFNFLLRCRKIINQVN